MYTIESTKQTKLGLFVMILDVNKNATEMFFATEIESKEYVAALNTFVK